MLSTPMASASCHAVRRSPMVVACGWSCTPTRNALIVLLPSFRREATGAPSRRDPDEPRTATATRSGGSVDDDVLVLRRLDPRHVVRVEVLDDRDDAVGGVVREL